MDKPVSDQFIGDVRRALVEASARTSTKIVMNLIEGMTGEPFPVTESMLHKFKKAGGLDSRAVHLLQDFFETPTGRLLRGHTATSKQLSDHIFQTLSAGRSAEPKDRKIEGAYYAYHGSHLERDHFVVRFVTISRARDGLLVYRDALNDNINGYQHYATGLVTFHRECPQILVLGRDNAVGFRLIVGDGDLPDSPHVIGQMMGLTKDIHHFLRAIMLKNIGDAVHHTFPSDLEFDEERFRTSYKEHYARQIDDTGIFRFDQMKEEHQTAFRHLAKIRSHQIFPDPIDDLMQHIT